MPEFGSTSKEYHDQVEESVAFVGADMDHITRVKALHVLMMLGRLVGSPETSSILDVGCGAGALDRMLAKSCRQVTGVDRSPDLVAAAAAAAASAASATTTDSSPPVNLTYRASDGGGLPFPDDTFDAAFTVNVLHHVPAVERDLFLAEMMRVTRPGGGVIVIEQNPLNPLTRRAVDRCPFDRDAELLAAGQARALLESAGAASLVHRNMLFTPWRLFFSDALERALWWLPVGAQYLVAGSKPVR